MKKLPNFVKWLIIAVVLAAMAAMMVAVNDRASRVEMPHAGQQPGHLSPDAGGVKNRIYGRIDRCTARNVWNSGLFVGCDKKSPKRLLTKTLVKLIGGGYNKRTKHHEKMGG